MSSMQQMWQDAGVGKLATSQRQPVTIAFAGRNVSFALTRKETCHGQTRHAG